MHAEIVLYVNLLGFDSVGDVARDSSVCLNSEAAYIISDASHGHARLRVSLKSVTESVLPPFGSWRAHLHVVETLRFVSDINRPNLPTPFCSVLVSISVFVALSTVFLSQDSPDNSPLFHSVLLVLFLPYCSPDVILCG